MHVVTCTQCCKDFWTDISQICSTCDAHNKTAEAGQKLADACRGVLLGSWTQRRQNLITALAAWDAAQEGGK